MCMCVCVCVFEIKIESVCDEEVYVCLCECVCVRESVCASACVEKVNSFFKKGNEGRKQTFNQRKLRKGEKEVCMCVCV